MILRAGDGLRGSLVDLDTGRPIPRAYWADTETGEYEAFRTGPDGRVLRDASGALLTHRGKGRLAFVPRPRPPADSKPEDLLAADRETLRRFRRVTGPLLTERCEHPGCTRLAGWAVTDEVPLAPVVRNGRRFARAAVVGRRCYCSWHYRGPRELDARGELVREDDEAGGARPQ